MKKILYTFLVLSVMFGFAGAVNALTVSPAKMEMTVDPGKTFIGQMEVFNEQDADKTFYSSYENFEANGESGAPSFIGGKKDLATWINTEQSITLKPGERKVIPFTIVVPQDAKPGGYFSAIFWGSQPPAGATGSQVSVGGKIGVLVLLRVSGAIEEKGGLLGFTGGNRFYSSIPVSFTYRFNNTGGDRVVPKGEIKIKNFFFINSATLLANRSDGSVLPNSTRKFDAVWGDTPANPKAGFFDTAMSQLKDFHFGWYRANLGISWGATNQTANTSFTFFVIPWQLLIIVFVVLLVLRYGLKWYNKRLVAQMMKK